MSFHHTIRRRLVALRLPTIALAAAALNACGGSTDSTAPLRSVAMTVSSAAMTIAAGGSGSSSLTIARTNFSGPIGLAVEKLPAGVTAAFAPQSATGNTSTLTFSTSLNAVPGTYTVLIRGAATGVADATAPFSLSITAAPADRAFKSVVTAFKTTCALGSSGLAYCWGDNSKGQFGNGRTSQTNNSTPTAAGEGLTFETLSMSTSGYFVCGIRPGGRAYCWGNNDSGQLGDGTTSPRVSPTPVAGELTFQSLSAGSDHTCGVTRDFAVYCWGFNRDGQLGNGTVVQQLTPVAVVAPGLTFKSVFAVQDYTCGLTQAGAAYCWGIGSVGQLGNGSIATRLIPVAVSGGLTFNTLATGSYNACGLTATGVAYCWGLNDFGQVGDGTSTLRSTPVAVTGGHRFNSISAGNQHSCAVATGGAAYCWGSNEAGALGDGTFTIRFDPTPVAGTFTFQDISIGFEHGCAITRTVGSSNDIYCWGANSAGQLGDGMITPRMGPFKVVWP